MLHRFPIGCASHNDSDFGFRTARHRRILTHSWRNFASCGFDYRKLQTCATFALNENVNTPGPSIVLIGFMGAGKSAVGRELAKRTGLPRHDLDELIRMRFQLSILDIFEQRGEPVFRDAETELLRKLDRGAVVVTGGGIVLREENVKLLRALGRTFWLDADEETLWRRASRRSTRPLLQAPNPREKFSVLFRERLSLYEAAADERVDVSDQNVKEVADQILALV
jgi:shikimate kinase